MKRSTERILTTHAGSLPRPHEVLELVEGRDQREVSSTPGADQVVDQAVHAVVRRQLDAGIDVTVLPGASAVETALVASGLAGGRYAFVGFLPRKAGELEALWRETTEWGCPVVAFESPHRLTASLRSLAVFDAEREVAVCRELTKRFEEVVQKREAELHVAFTRCGVDVLTLSTEDDLVSAVVRFAARRKQRRGMRAAVAV